MRKYLKLKSNINLYMNKLNIVKSMFKELPLPNCRKEYFRHYYLTHKNKYIKDELRPEDKKKRGRPKKIIPPFTINSGVYIVSWD